MPAVVPAVDILRQCLQIGFQLAKPGWMKDFAGTWTIQPLTNKDLLHTSVAANQMSQSKQQGTEAKQPMHLPLGCCFVSGLCCFSHCLESSVLPKQARIINLCGFEVLIAQRNSYCGCRSWCSWSAQHAALPESQRLLCHLGAVNSAWLCAPKAAGQGTER